MDAQQSNQTSGPSGEKSERGSCHCGDVHFEVKIDLSAGVARCNCSICTKLSPRGAIVRPAAFTLLQGRESLQTYKWGAEISERFFCKRCGTLVYGAGYLEEVGGDYVSINCNTLDGIEIDAVPVIYWDGRHDNWHAGPRSEPWPIHSAPKESAQASG
jgi:hypothetical protein